MWLYGSVFTSNYLKRIRHKNLVTQDYWLSDYYIIPEEPCFVQCTLASICSKFPPPKVVVCTNL